METKGIRMKNKKCDKCGKPFPKEDKGLSEDIKQLLDKVTTCTECLQNLLRLGNEKQMTGENNEANN